MQLFNSLIVSCSILLLFFFSRQKRELCYWVILTSHRVAKKKQFFCCVSLFMQPFNHPITTKHTYLYKFFRCTYYRTHLNVVHAKVTSSIKPFVFFYIFFSRFKTHYSLFRCGKYKLYLSSSTLESWSHSVRNSSSDKLSPYTTSNM